MATKKWVLPVLVLVCGLALRSSGQLVGVDEKIFVLKGASSYTTNYVYDDSKADLNVALGLDRVVSVKPKVYFYLVCNVAYEPTSTVVRGVDTWTGEGNLDIWPTRLIVYGVGRHSLAGVWPTDGARPVTPWNAKATYSYDAGSCVWPIDMSWLAKGKRVGTTYMAPTDPRPDALIEYTDSYSTDMLALVTCAAKKMTTKVPVATWYEPSAITIELYSNLTQVLGTLDPDVLDLINDGDENTNPMAFVQTQIGAVKVKFTTDTNLTKIANTAGQTVAQNLAAVSDAIDAALVKAKYQAVNAEISEY